MRHLLIILLNLTILLQCNNCYSQTDSLIIQGEKFTQSRDYIKAKICLNKALEFSKSNDEKGKIYRIFGVISHLERKHQESIKFYNKSISYYAISNNTSEQTRTLNNLGIAYKRLNQPSKAIETYNEAYKLTNNPNEKTTILNNIGRILFASQNYQKGLAYFKNLLLQEEHYLIHQNIGRLYKKLNKQDSAIIHYQSAVRLISPYSPTCIEIQKELGDLYYSLNNFEKALEIYENSIKTIEKLRNSYTADQLKLYFSEKHKGIYVSAIECAAKLNKPGKVCDISIQLKAPILSQKLNLPDSIRILTNKLDHHISKSLKNKEYSRLDSLIKIKDEITKTIEIDKFDKSILPDNLTVLDYIHSDSILIINSISKKEVKTISMSITEEFKTRIDSFNSYVTSFTKTSYQEYLNYFNVSHSLWNELIPETNSKRLTIIPYGEIYKIPFETLTLSSPSKEWASFYNVEFLIHKYAISYNYSLNGIAAEKERRIKDAVAFVPDQELEYNLQEAEELRRRYNTKILKGAKADKESFFKLKGDIISITSHGDSGEIRLFEDTIHLSELYNLNLENDLTVLSACNTLTGNLKSTEGYLSTAREFLKAGSKSVLAAMYQLHDFNTKNITSLFYEELKNGYSKDVALQHAKIRHIETSESLYRSPSMWGGLILIGDTSPIPPKNSYLILIVLVSIIIPGLLIFFRKYFKGRA